MGEVTSVSIDSSAETIEKTPQDYVAEAEAAAVPEESPRPEWLPEKFESPEALAEAYTNLEKKMGANEPPEPSRSDLMENKNIDMAALEKEYQNNGELSVESYDAAAKAGYPKAVVDNYIAGQQAIVDKQVSEIFEYSGGRQEYIDLIEWAGDELPDDEIDSFNKTVAANDVAAIKLAISGLKARKAEMGPKDPARQIEGGAASVADKFESWAQVKEAMSDPRYETDPAYNNSVVQKIGRSSL